MLKYVNYINTQKDILYNNILLLSRNKLFYTKLNLIDSFQNRIHLIFIHISFIFIKIKQNNKNKIYKIFYQKMFDLIFNKIELNMREIGYGDIIINKNMKYLVKIFYNILLNCENYKKKSLESKCLFLLKYLKQNIDKNINSNAELVKYFNDYQAFCFDLSSDSVLRGDLNFIYKFYILLKKNLFYFLLKNNQIVVLLKL